MARRRGVTTTSSERSSRRAEAEVERQRGQVLDALAQGLVALLFREHAATPPGGE